MASTKQQILIICLVALVVSFSFLLKSYHNSLQPQKYQDRLMAQISGTTYIKVVPTNKENAANQAFDENDEQAISNLIDNICIVSSCGGVCGCAGDVILDFYKDEKLCASLSFHHGKNLRWSKQWPADMELSSESAEYIVRWLSMNGVTDIN